MIDLGSNDEGGFTLLEALVALVILSVSLGALYQAAAGSTRNVGVGTEYSEALILAESLLADAQYVDSDGFDGRGDFDHFSWTVESEPVSSGEDSDTTESVKLQQVRVRIAWGDGDRDRSLELVSVVPQQEQL